MNYRKLIAPAFLVALPQLLNLAHALEPILPEREAKVAALISGVCGALLAFLTDPTKESK